MDERRLRVVICDDDRTVRHVVGSMAEECGFDVVGEAALALEALVLVEMTSAHVLVLDLSLTCMSGTEIIASVKAAAPDTAIIVYTAFDSRRDEAMAAGAFDVVDKADANGLAALESTLQVVAETLASSPRRPQPAS